MKLKFMLLTVSILHVVACTHTPSVGEKMLSRSNEARILSEQWTNGENQVNESKKLEQRRNKLIHSGNKKIIKGKKLISNGENEINKGNKMRDLARVKLENGQRLQQESKSQFIEQYPGKLE
ncbi:MAG: hypothetical protein P4L65_10530 [Legionella sp.]|nr:hypothetical protein [Legionella sp.]